MLVVGFILLDICMFSFISIPLYRVFCDQSVALLQFYSGSELFSLCTLTPICAAVQCIGMRSFCAIQNDTSMARFVLFNVHGVIKVECYLDAWYFVMSVCAEVHDIDTTVLQVEIYVRRSELGMLEFYSLQNKLCVAYDEITLSFFRLYNPTHYSYTCIFVYLVYPLSVGAYISKVQCFCFDSLLIRSFEVFDLPVLFFIGSGIQNIFWFYLDKLAFLYVLFVV